MKKFNQLDNFEIILHHTPKLEILEITKTTTPTWGYKFFNFFSPGKLENLKYLDISENDIPDYFPPNTSDGELYPLDLFDSSFLPEKFCSLLEFIEKHQNLIHVNLSGHYFTEEVTCSLESLIQHNTKLEVLKISNTDMHTTYTSRIVKSLLENSTLKILNLKECCLDQNTRKEVQKIMENKNISIIIRDKQ